MVAQTIVFRRLRLRLSLEWQVTKNDDLPHYSLVAWGAAGVTGIL